MSKFFIGTDDFDKTVNRIVKQGKADLEDVLVGAATQTQKNAIKGLQEGPATGAIYKKTNPNRTHQASAQGEYPQSDTGTLVRNIKIKREGYLDYTVGSRSGAPHGFYLEMKPPSQGGRPWLSRAFNEMQVKLNTIIRQKT